MAFQKIFKARYAEQLYDEARYGIGLDRWKLDEFPYDESQTIFAARVMQPEGLVDRMPIDDDLQSAIALYEAYKNLTPLQASDHNFWIYLAHADLYQYVHKRFGKVAESNDPVDYVTTHYFFGRELVRNALAGLWWNVYCTVDETLEDKYKYTKFLFDNYDLRMITFANYKMFRNKQQALGMMHFWLDHPEVVKNKYRSRFCTKYFNHLAGSKQLITLPQEFFYNELERLLPQIMAVKESGDISEVVIDE